MEHFLLEKNRLNEFLSALRNYEVLAPVKKDGLTVFELITNPNEVVLDLKNQPNSPKRAIFPQTEILFVFDKSNAAKEPQGRAGQKQQIVFGIRPCDARGFHLLDPVFEKEYPDPYFIQKRQSTILIGIQCSEPYSNCFCTSVGGNPSSSEGLDILLTDLGEQYFFEVVTSKGEQLAKEAVAVLSSPTSQQQTEKEKRSEMANQKIRRTIDTDGIASKIKKHFDDSLWKELSEKCISCGICTYTCPTCHCFDIQDERVKGKAHRLRIWDSCMFPEYTLHASGHNPRPTRAERLRNRIYHKFKQNIEIYGVPGCVGCGRCITLCPENVDLVANLQMIKNL
jgi:sulfhydrogenase subunit beta (sulfur reductase)